MSVTRKRKADKFVNFGIYFKISELKYEQGDLSYEAFLAHLTPTTSHTSATGRPPQLKSQYNLTERHEIY